jgi:hypothetical protein
MHLWWNAQGYYIRFIFFFFTLLLTVGMSESIAYGQSNNEWMPPMRIPQYDDEARPPVLLADRNQTVHVLNLQPFEDGYDKAIFYRQWRLDSGWSDPIDVLLSPDTSEPRLRAAFLDHNDIIHLIFFSGNEQGARIYYSNSPAATANSARSWMQPQLIGEEAGPFAYADLSGDDQGNLYVTYSGRRDGFGLYTVYSRDGGESWSEPHTVFVTYSEYLFAIHVKSTVDAEGNLHIVWSTVGPQGLGLEVIYASYNSYHRLWSEPVTLAKRAENGYKADWPAITTHQNQLIVFYMDGNPPSQYMLRSFDGGKTWTPPVRPFTHTGEYEHAVFLEDGDGRLHIVLGFRRGDCCHGMWHSVWLGDRWGDPQAIVMGPKSPTFDPSAPSAVISQGNVLLTTWWTDTGGGPRNGSWFSYTQLNASQLPLIPLLQPTPTSVPTQTPVPTSTPLPPTPTPMPAILVESGEAGSPLTEASAVTVVFLSVLPALLLSLSVIAIYRVRRRVV